MFYCLINNPESGTVSRTFLGTYDTLFSAILEARSTGEIKSISGFLHPVIGRHIHHFRYASPRKEKTIGETPEHPTDKHGRSWCSFAYGLHNKRPEYCERATSEIYWERKWNSELYYYLTPPQSVVVQHRRELKQVLSHYGVNSLFKQLQAPNEITINYPENVGEF